MRNGLPRILLIRLSAIGDVVRVLPAVQCLRAAFPCAQLDFAVEAKAADVVLDHRLLDQVWVFDRSAGRGNLSEFGRFAGRLRKARYDVVVDFHGILKSGVLCGASGAPKRVGFARPRSQEGSSLFTNHKVRLPERVLNRVEENLLLCAALGPVHGAGSVPVEVPDAVQSVVDAYVDATFEAGKRLVVLHVPVDRAEKQWPVEYYARLADMLAADGRFEPLMTGGPGQMDLVQDAAKRARAHPITAPLSPDLKHFAWLLHRADLFVGGDTGPMHLAAAMGTPVVAIFGGTDPRRHAPYGVPYEVLDGAAGSTGRRPANAMENVSPDSVYDVCVRLACLESEELVRERVEQYTKGLSAEAAPE